MQGSHPQGAFLRAETHLRNGEHLTRRRGRPPVPADVLVTAGAAMRARREELQLTLSYIADRVRVSSVHLSEVERGRSGASADLLEAWALAIGLDVAEVLCAFRVVPDRVAAEFFDPDRMRAALAGGATGHVPLVEQPWSDPLPADLGPLGEGGGHP
jgi:transcriptional regulator with XRE-family HTH domain